MQFLVEISKIFLPCFFFALQVGAITTIKEYSLIGPYEGDVNTHLLNWDLTGCAEINPTVVRLTPDDPGKQGAIWNNIACDIRDWEFQVHFRIHGKGINLNGDGIAIWYAKEPLHLGPVFGSKDYFSGLGVFLDTYENESTEKHVYPRISAMVNNGSLHYNSNDDGIHTQIAGCHAKLINLDYSTRVAVSYVRSSLTIYVDAEGKGEWKQCFVARGIHLPTGYYFGLSASTGELSDYHDVIALTLLNMEPPDVQKEDRQNIIPEAEYFELPKEYKGEAVKDKHPKEDDDGEEQHSASIFKIILYIAITATVLTVVAIMFKKYNLRRKEKLNKRLY